MKFNYVYSNRSSIGQLATENNSLYFTLWINIPRALENSAGILMFVNDGGILPWLQNLKHILMLQIKNKIIKQMTTFPCLPCASRSLVIMMTPHQMLTLSAPYVVSRI
jgi:hypothetical protein